MSDDKKYDEETQKFYDENKEMIEKILAQEKSAAETARRICEEEARRRTEFEEKIRKALEEEKLRRQAFEASEKAYSDLMQGRARTEAAFDESLEHMREYSKKKADYIMDMLLEGSSSLRENLIRGSEYAQKCREEDSDRFKEARDRARETINGGLDEMFAPFADAQFQKHVFGAGLEFWMAMNALIKAAPVPDSVKEAFTAAEANKNAEFCTKNEACRKNGRADDAAGEPKKITISKKAD